MQIGIFRRNASFFIVLFQKNAAIASRRKFLGFCGCKPPFERASFFQNRGLQANQSAHLIIHLAAGLLRYIAALYYCYRIKRFPILSGSIGALYPNCIHRGNMRLLAFFSLRVARQFKFLFKINPHRARTRKNGQLYI